MLRTDAEIESILAAFDEAVPEATETQRKRFERKLRSDRGDSETTLRMIENHRAYLSVLNAVRKILYSHDEREIVADFVRNVVGFFRLAKGWFGFVDGRKITPIFHAGPAAQFVEVKELSIGRNEHSTEFPLLTALRRGKPLVLDSLARNPAFAPWSDFVVPAGIRSFLAVPLEIDETILGGFVFYADTEGVFDASTVDYLQTAIRELERSISEKRDVEHRERVLRLAKEEAEDTNRLKDQFLATMSHEIRTPMNAILGYAELLDDPALTPEDRHEAIGVIRNNGEYLLRILNDILDLSKMRAGKLDLEIHPLSLPRLLGDVALLYRKKAGQKGLNFTVTNLTPIPETIKSDPVRLKQILLNLVSNAVKFTMRGGVFVSLSWEDNAPDFGLLRITVRDTGIGMSPETISSVFIPFYQADETTARRFGGTGLGLPITNRLVELFGGKISLSSEPGKGTIFTITLRVSIDPRVERVQLPEEPWKLSVSDERPPVAMISNGTRPLSGRRILLAEDDGDARRLFVTILDKAGAETVVVENGQKALELGLQASESFDLVLMDMQMPVLDGYAAIVKLRRAGFTVPIVALSAHVLQEEIDRCLELGCNDCVIKPVSRDQLIDAIQRNCRTPERPGRG